MGQHPGNLFALPGAPRPPLCHLPHAAAQRVPRAWGPLRGGDRDEPEGAGQTPPPARVRPADDAAPSTPPVPLTLSLSSRVSRILRSFRDSGLLVCAEGPPAPLLRPLAAPVAGTATTSPLPSAIAPRVPPPNSAPATLAQSTDAPAAP